MNLDPNTIVVAAVGILSLVVLVLALIKIQSLSKSIQRLADQIPTQGMTAKELGAELGGAIESSFQKYMPQPEKVSAAITSAVEASIKSAAAGLESASKNTIENQNKSTAAITASIEGSLKNAAASLEGVHKKIADAQGAVLDKWAAHEKSATGGLDAIRKALEGATQQLGVSLNGGSDKMQASLDGGAKKLADTLGSLATKLEASLHDHADKTTKASAQLAAQLEKIATLEKEIDKLLHLQQATEGTIKSVAASEDFKALVKALRDHLQASDNLIREAAKPRTIRLVESES